MEILKYLTTTTDLIILSSVDKRFKEICKYEYKTNRSTEVFTLPLKKIKKLKLSNKKEVKYFLEFFGESIKSLKIRINCPYVSEFKYSHKFYMSMINKYCMDELTTLWIDSLDTKRIKSFQLFKILNKLKTLTFYNCTFNIPLHRLLNECQILENLTMKQCHWREETIDKPRHKSKTLCQ